MSENTPHQSDAVLQAELEARMARMGLIGMSMTVIPDAAPVKDDFFEVAAQPLPDGADMEQLLAAEEEGQIWDGSEDFKPMEFKLSL